MATDAFGARVTLLHVVPRFAEHALEMAPIPETHWAAMRTRAARFLEEMAQMRFPDLMTTPVVAQGDPAEEIAAAVESRHTDLIMMPTHGTGRFRAALLGSVSAKVLTDVPCPVWTSAHPEESMSSVDEGIRTVLCGVRPGGESLSLLRSAAAFSAKTGAKMWLLHAVPGEECLPPREMNAGFERWLKDAATHSIARLQAEAGTAFEVCVASGKPSRVIAEAARRHHADLVLIGRGAQSAGPVTRGNVFHYSRRALRGDDIVNRVSIG